MPRLVGALAFLASENTAPAGLAWETYSIRANEKHTYMLTIVIYTCE